MPCYHPLEAFQTAAGDVVFVEGLRRHDVVRTLSLPCGRCIGCRLERSRQWAMRCLHESSLSERNSFVTLTYDDDHLPAGGSLVYPDFQRFMKRLRKAAGVPVRFFMCGEYGDELGRPHYHALLFGLDFPDQYYWKTVNGAKYYRSPSLEGLWRFGDSLVGALTFESAAYCARYCVKKVNGPDADDHYQGRAPEFAHMSLKPGIGARWLERWRSDVYPHDFVVVNGKEVKPPKYYDRLFRRVEPDVFEDLQFLREQDGRSRFLDNTPERLEVREVVHEARASFLVRKGIV